MSDISSSKSSDVLVSSGLQMDDTSGQDYGDRSPAVGNSPKRWFKDQGSVTKVSGNFRFRNSTNYLMCSDGYSKYFLMNAIDHSGFASVTLIFDPNLLVSWMNRIRKSFRE